MLNKTRGKFFSLAGLPFQNLELGLFLSGVLVRQLRVCDTNCVKTLKTWSLSYRESTPQPRLERRGCPGRVSIYNPRHVSLSGPSCPRLLATVNSRTSSQRASLALG